jgi:outer membrane protein OmpA-like peptidoglycan-associated protein
MKKQQWIILLLLLGQYFAFAQNQAGLYGEYFNGKSFDELVMTRRDADINFVWNHSAPHRKMDPGNFSVRWQGQIRTPKTGKYMFRAVVDDGMRLWVNGQRVIDAWGMNDSEPFSGSITLEGGRHYDLKVEYFNGLLEGEIQLRWQMPGEEPLFGGLMGYNDKPIDEQYFSHTPPTILPKPVAQASKPPAKPTLTPSAPSKPATPAPKIVKTPPVVAPDTLERYLPKNIIFERGNTVILSKSMADLDNLASFLKRNLVCRLRIEGHTDRIGNAEKNLALSQDRAKAVAAYLANKGISPARMKTNGFGDTRPLFKNTDGQADERNRRVEFYVE